MPTGLLEPRLYRAAFAPALLALIILAFSLQDPARALTPELAPPTFSAQRAISTAKQLVAAYGERQSGSAADRRVAQLVQARFTDLGFSTSSYKFDATTLHGEKTLVNVVGIRPGPSDRRLVIIASRDGGPGDLRQTGSVETGMLLELARVLQGRAFGHSLVLASVSGGADGGLGAAELARRLRGPVDGVIVLRNIATDKSSAPVLASYDSRLRPDPQFERTVDRVLSIELKEKFKERSTLAQLVRMGFPLALGEQATFLQHGLSAVSISPGGEQLAPTDLTRVAPVAASGRATLRALTTFDGGFRPTAPAREELQVGSKLIPAWALLLFIGALLFPLIVVAVDAWARARRWHQVSTRGFVTPPLAFVWLAALAVLLRALGAIGLIDAPALPADPSASSSTGAVVVGILLLLLGVGGVVVAGASVRQFAQKGGEAGFAIWLVVAAIVLFILNPVAVGFWLIFLHLVVLLLLSGTRPRRAQVWLFALLGILPVLFAALYYPSVLGIGIFGSVRFAVLLEAGGFVGFLATFGGSLLIAAAFTAVLHLHWTAPARNRDSTPRPSVLQ